MSNGMPGTPTVAPQSSTVSPLSLGVLYRTTWELFRKNLRRLVLLQLVFSIITAVVGVLAVVLGLAGSLGIFSGIFASGNVDANVVGGTFFGAGILFVLVAIVIGLLVSAWQQATLLLAINGAQGSVQETLRMGAKKMGATFFVLILTAIFVTIGFALLFFPGIYAAVVLSFAVPIAVLEGVTGGNALRRSREYVRGHWWEVFIAGIVYAILISIAYGIVTAIFNSSPSLDWIVTSFAGLITAPLGACFLFVLYKTLKSMKESGSTTSV